MDCHLNGLLTLDELNKLAAGPQLKGIVDKYSSLGASEA